MQMSLSKMGLKATGKYAECTGSEGLSALEVSTSTKAREN
jgi:hypothetical protein